jgi:cold shock CspA family protein
MTQRLNKVPSCGIKAPLTLRWPARSVSSDRVGPARRAFNQEPDYRPTPFNSERHAAALMGVAQYFTSLSDVFVHVHDVEAAGLKLLEAGQLVAYEVGPARDGRSKAVNLRLLER